jgi:hypothetical protein
VEAVQRQELIARYRDGYQVVVDALGGITEVEMDADALDGWTVREIVHHLADSEMTSAIRLRRLLAEENPVIQGYDEEAFARRLYYRQRPIDASLAALRASRESTATILDHMTEADWQQAGTHSDSGPYTAETWLEIYAAHAHDHAAQIRRARGGPMTDVESK